MFAFNKIVDSLSKHILKTIHVMIFQFIICVIIPWYFLQLKSLAIVLLNESRIFFWRMNDAIGTIGYHEQLRGCAGLWSKYRNKSTAFAYKFIILSFGQLVLTSRALLHSLIFINNNNTSIINCYLQLINNHGRHATNIQFAHNHHLYQFFLNDFTQKNSCHIIFWPVKNSLNSFLLCSLDIRDVLIFF